MKTLNIIVLVLVIVGGLNWGLVGIAGFDLVASIFGEGTVGEAGPVGSVVYILVGIAAIWAISFFGMVGGGAAPLAEPMRRAEEETTQ